MKKAMTIVMAMVIVMIATATFAFATDNDIVPEIEFYDGGVSWLSYYGEMHIDMYCSLPEYGDVLVRMCCTLDKDAVHGNECKAVLYDMNDNKVDEIDGYLSVDLSGCENMLVASRLVRESFDNYDWKADADQGVTYKKVIVW